MKEPTVADIRAWIKRARAMAVRSYMIKGKRVYVWNVKRRRWARTFAEARRISA